MMNKNRIFKQAAVVGLSTALAVTSYPTIINGKIDKKQKEDSQLSKAENKIKSNISKDETVYVNADAAGNVSEITVTDWLKNVSISGSLNDMTELADILNIKGEETFSLDNNQLTWNAVGEDIYYQGKTQKTLPVTMKITYQLDGNEIKPEDLVGKSGKFKMQIEYQNHEKSGKVYVPFTMITGAIFPTEHFSNITIDHGKVLSDATKNIVVGVALPGLQDSLDLRQKDIDIELPSSLTITADVTDFEMGSTYTIASSELLSMFDLDTSKVKGIDTLKDSMNDLQDASSDLVKGSKDLSEGISTLKSKSGTFTKGIESLTNGLGQLKDGTGTLKDGVVSYTEGANQLADGVTQYVKGASDLADGIEQYTDGAGKLADGINQLAGAATQIPEKLDQLSSGLMSANLGVSLLIGNTQKLEDGAQSVSAGIDHVHDALSQLDGGLSGSMETLSATADALSQSLESNAALLETLMALPEEQRVQCGEAIASLQQNIEVQKGILEQLSNSSASGIFSQAADAIHSLAQTTGELKTGASTVANGLGKLTEGENTLKEGFQKFSDSKGELNELKTALPSALDQLQTGARQLTGNSKNLVNGAQTLVKEGEKLINGAQTLKKNSGSLTNGVSTLSSAADKLQEGGSQLNDGKSQLIDGIDQLVDGSKDLNQGMKKFDKKGIQKLHKTLEEDVNQVIDRLDDLTNAGDNYQSFSGIQKEMNGSVKFIIQTAELRK